MGPLTANTHLGVSFEPNVRVSVGPIAHSHFAMEVFWPVPMASLWVGDPLGLWSDQARRVEPGSRLGTLVHQNADWPRDFWLPTCVEELGVQVQSH